MILKSIIYCLEGDFPVAERC